MSAVGGRLGKSLAHHRSAFRSLGLKGWLSLEAQLRNRAIAETLQHRLPVKRLESPLEYRPEESDLEAFIQVFVRNEYGAIGPIDPEGIIIDCGANVGYTTAWLHRIYPDTHIVAVEPLSDNFRLLERNVASFRHSVTTVQGGVWSRPCGLVLEMDEFRDGLSWSTRVREARPGEEPQAAGFDIPSLMQMRSARRIALLKMDVERAEAEIFAHATEWIARCDVIAIELHDDECERVFHSAIDGMGFDIAKSGELTICRQVADLPKGDGNDASLLD